MKTIHVYKAWTLEHEAPMPDVTIVIEEQIQHSPLDTTMEQMDARFRGEAEKIMEGLNSLPGGTRYQLMILMLQAHPYRWIVPCPEKS